MNRINPAKLSQNNFRGIKNMDKELKTLDNGIKHIIQELGNRAEREVPPYGDFAPVYEQFANPDKTLCVSDFMLKIVKPPSSIEGHERIRNLALVAYKLPSAYKAEMIISTGNQKEILQTLKSPDLLDKVKDAAKNLAYSMEDI